MIRVYGLPASPNVFRVLLALEEKGVEYEVDHDIVSEEFMKKSRFGLMPLLDHDGVLVPESFAILEYLEEAGIGPTLLPKDPKARAQVRAWSYHVVFDVIAKRNAAFQDPQQKSAFVMALRNLDNELKDKTYLCGEKFSLADVCLAGLYVAWDAVTSALQVDTSRFKNLHAHRMRIASRPAFQSIDPSVHLEQFLKNLTIPAEYAKFQERQKSRRAIWQSVWNLS